MPGRMLDIFAFLVNSGNLHFQCDRFVHLLIDPPFQAMNQLPHASPQPVVAQSYLLPDTSTFVSAKYGEGFEYIPVYVTFSSGGQVSCWAVICSVVAPKLLTIRSSLKQNQR